MFLNPHMQYLYRSCCLRLADGLCRATHGGNSSCDSVALGDVYVVVSCDRFPFSWPFAGQSVDFVMVPTALAGLIFGLGQTSASC